MLVVLDLPAELETTLTSWIVPTLVESRWRIALGYLMAELERLHDATRQFEEVATLGELTEANYVSLACVPPGFTAQDWVLALGLDKISSIARYDTNTGRWTTLAVDQGSLVGENFEIQFGEGYLIYAREAAGPFQP